MLDLVFTKSLGLHDEGLEKPAIDSVLDRAKEVIKAFHAIGPRKRGVTGVLAQNLKASARAMLRMGCVSFCLH